MRTIAAVLMLALAACDGAVTDEHVGQTRVRLDLSALRADHLSHSVLALMTLRWGPNDIDAMSQQLSGGEDEVEFRVTIPPGGLTFEATVFSNNGARLYAASALIAPRRNGFTEELNLEPVGPVMSVTPDTLHLRSAQVDTVFIRNVGRGELSWNASGPCGTTLCLTPRVSFGIVFAGQVATVVVSGRVSNQPAVAMLRIDSNVGVIMVPARINP
jgi:hypothetical protein